MLLEQGYGQQLIGHLQPAPLLQRAAFMLPLGRSGGSDQLSPRSTRAQQEPPPQRSVRSVYTQTPLEHMGSFEDEPGMSQAHEVRLGDCSVRDTKCTTWRIVVITLCFVCCSALPRVAKQRLSRQCTGEG